MHVTKTNKMDKLLRDTVNAVVNSRFPEMSQEGRRQIETMLIREEFPKGTIALKEGEIANEIVFIGKGMIRQFYYKNGKDVTEHFSYEGCITMCIESFLRQVPTKLMVETVEPTILYKFPRERLFQLAKENWEINMFYRKILEYSSLFPNTRPIPGVSNPPASAITCCWSTIPKSSSGPHWLT